MNEIIMLNHFHFLTNPQLQNKLLENSTILTIKKGETIIREGQYLKVLPLILKGSIRVFQQQDDRETLLYYVSAGETCMMSLSSCFFNSPSKSFAVAEEDTDILCVPVKFISEWQLEYKEWNDFVIGTFKDRYDELLESFNCVVFNNIETRIIAYLRNYVTKHKVNPVPFTHIQLANELGTTRVVTSRILKKFEQENKIKLLRSKIEVINL